MNCKINEDFHQFQHDLLRFIKSELAGDGTVVTKDGKLWLRFPVRLAAELHPHKTSRQIRHALEVMVDTGFLFQMKVESSRFDNSNWYALVDQPENMV